MSTIKEKGCVSMKIQAVLIDGFKNLSNVKISFDNITALVALNNFGKSNVLSGIDFGLAFIKATIEDNTWEIISVNHLIFKSLTNNWVWLIKTLCIQIIFHIYLHSI